jgi:hypothetical protein
VTLDEIYARADTLLAALDAANSSPFSDITRKYAIVTALINLERDVKVEYLDSLFAANGMISRLKATKSLDLSAPKYDIIDESRQ